MSASGPVREPDIEVRGLRVLGRHGVLDEEKARTQPFEIDIAAWLDTSRAQRSDALADTANYAELATIANDIITSTRFELLEALTATIANALLEAAPLIDSLTVTIAKLRPPIPLDIDSVVVRTHATRSHR